MLKLFLIHLLRSVFFHTVVSIYSISPFLFLSMSILLSENQQQQLATSSVSDKTPDCIRTGRPKVWARCRILGGHHKVLRK